MITNRSNIFGKNFELLENKHRHGNETTTGMTSARTQKKFLLSIALRQATASNW